MSCNRDRFDLVLVGCGARKRSGVAPAGDMYTGDLFELSRAWAERNAPRWAVLSAKWCLLWPDEKIQPYNLALQTQPAAWRNKWARIAADMVNESRRGPCDDGPAIIGRRAFCGRRVAILAGAAYADPLRPLLEADGYTVNEPLRGLFIGQRKQWLQLALEGADA
jgi:hypothetical protein